MEHLWCHLDPTSLTYTVNGKVWGSESNPADIPSTPMHLDLQQQTWCGAAAGMDNGECTVDGNLNQCRWTGSRSTQRISFSIHELPHSESMLPRPRPVIHDGPRSWNARYCRSYADPGVGRNEGSPLDVKR